MPVTILLDQLPPFRFTCRTLKLNTNDSGISYVGCETLVATLRVEHKSLSTYLETSFTGKHLDMRNELHCGESQNKYYVTLNSIIDSDKTVIRIAK
jgi:hypothetical protein